MIRTRNRTSSTFSPMKEAARKAAEEWEMRPGGMLVQKRGPDSESVVTSAGVSIPTIRVKVKYDSVYYEIYLSSQSTFGELKKLLAERTGVHWEEQRILYREREREGREFLDVSGVKDKSKLVMVVDPNARARRVVEMRRAVRAERAARGVDDGGATVDRLAVQVLDMESTISKGKKVAAEDLSSLIEQLMMQLVILDAIVAEGDLKLQKGVQIRRIQKYVEALDVLKIKNGKILTSSKQNQHQNKQESSVVVTTEWEMFDSLFGPSTSTSTSTTMSSSASSNAPPRSDWELF